MSSRIKRCELCIHLFKTGGSDTECHVEPPKAFLIPGPMSKISGDPAFRVMGCWPPTRLSNSCGSFDPKLD